MSVGTESLRIYLDEDVDVLLASLLAIHAVDGVTALGVGHLGWSDDAHLEYAVQESRVLVTHNRVDYETLARSWWGQHKDHPGIVLAIRRVDTYELARHMLTVLRQYNQAGWRNAVLYA